MTRNVIGKWGSRFLFAVLVVSLCRSGGGQQEPAATRMQQLQRQGGVLTALAARLTLECSADSGSIVAGQTGVVRARGVSSTGSALTYSFAADAGRLTAKGGVATLRTAGVGPRVVRVTCTVKDSEGHSASKVVQVTLRPAVIFHGGLPAPVLRPAPAPITRTEESKAPTKAEPPPAPAPAPAPAPPSIPVTSPVESERPPIAAAPVHPTPTDGRAPASVEPTPSTDSTQPPAAVDGYQQGRTFDEWKKGLKTGKIEYEVPTRMLMQHASMATVVIHGYGDTATTTLPNATGSGSLTQSERMKVELLAEDHPGDFTIVAQGDAVQFVPISGATTWTWSVTPNTPGKKELTVRASVIYPGGDEKMQQQLKPYTAVVAVNVPSLWERIVESYREDPLKWFSYVVPGGAGFTFLVGIVVWWWKKKKA